MSDIIVPLTAIRAPAMDLLATVRKEGSRGGRGDFKWSDVQGSSHREHYLGHSVMAPVGRWQKGRDLNWYAKADDDDADSEAAEARAARERREEIQRVKEAEQDAMARALGLPVPDRTNANLEEVSNKREFDRVLNEAVGDQGPPASGGVGYGRVSGGNRDALVTDERIEGNAETQDRELQYALREYRRRQGHRESRRRSRSRSEARNHGEKDSREKGSRRDREHGDRHRHRRRNASRSREHRRRRHSRSRSRSRDQGERNKRRGRSESPDRREDRRSERGRRHDR